MAKYLWDRAWALCQQNNLPQARQAFQKLVERDERHVAGWFHLGLTCYRLGDFPSAIVALRRAIELRPEYPEALNNLGNALAHEQRWDEAEDCFQRALKLAGNYAEARNNLGNVYRDQGRVEEAIGQYRQALELHPDYADAHNNLGIAHARGGDLAAAEACYQRALELRPDYAEAHNNLGICCARQSRFEEAVASFDRALRARPNYAEAYTNMGLAFADQGRHDDAVASYRKAIELAPNLARAHNNLGNLNAEQGRIDEAVGHYQNALRAAPDYAEAHNNLGNALREKADFEGAVQSLRRAIAIKPNYADAHNNLAIALSKLRAFTDSLRHYARAIQLREHYPDAHMNRALTLLLVGEFAAGWDEYEWRWKCKDFNAREFNQPRWEGEPLAGRRILLHTEQGLGDTFQFVRYARLVRERGGQVVVRCPKPLVALLKLSPDVAEVCVEGGDTPAFDVHLPLLSLPKVLGTGLDSVPAEVPYLHADPALVEHWQRQLSYIRGLKVGVNWQGNPRYRGDRHRSIPLAHFAPLAAVEGVRLVSLQKGYGAEQLREVRFSVTELGPQLDEAAGAFMDTAAVLQNLDVLVTSDTAMAHLAGALGVPVWLALPYAPDWRWMLGRDDSPWYPTMRLFRQSRQGDWEEVFERMARELAGSVGAQGPVRALTATPSAAELNARGVELAQRGRLDEALVSFRNAVSLNAEYPDAHNNLGNALRALGRTKEAIDHLRRAIALRADYPEAQYNLGIALTQDAAFDEAAAALMRALEMQPTNPLVHNSLGVARMNQLRWDDALGSFLQAIRLKPDLPSAHFNAGNALIELRRTEEALAAFREAVRIDPAFADAYNSLGNALREADRLDESIEAFEQALQHRPGFAEAYNNLGIALARQSRYELAIKNYEQALKLRPHYAAAHNNLGIAYANQLEFAKAMLSYQQAIAIKPDYTEAFNNLAIVQTQQGQYEEAFASYHRAIELKPNYAEAHSNLGIALTEAARTDEALAHYAQALQLREHYPDAHMNRALTLLLVGEFAAGWDEYEWRWKCKDFNTRNFSQPRWEGEPLAGRRILLHTEQGLGDTFQFVRYARLVRERGGQVVVRCPKPLVALLKLSPDVAEVCVEGGDTPAFDVHLPLLSLPKVLGTGLDSVPAEVPYLHADPALVEHWQRQLSYIRGLKVGVNWQGNPRYRGDRHRSIPLAHFAPLAAVEGVRLISLQKGFGSEQLREVRFSVTELGPQVDEAAGAFMDTAAVLQNLDVLVTSDTALAHLAGALGVRTWLALPYAPDWRWMLSREDSPWYPTMRLFRQSRQGDWEEVFQRVGAALEQEAAGRLDRDAVLVPLPLGKLVELLVTLELDLDGAGTGGDDLARLRSRHRDLSEILSSALRGPPSAQLRQIQDELRGSKRKQRDLENKIRALDPADPAPPDPVAMLLRLDELRQEQRKLELEISNR